MRVSVGDSGVEVVGTLRKVVAMNDYVFFYILWGTVVLSVACCIRCLCLPNPAMVTWKEFCDFSKKASEPLTSYTFPGGSGTICTSMSELEKFLDSKGGEGMVHHTNFPDIMIGTERAGCYWLTTNSSTSDTRAINIYECPEVWKYAISLQQIVLVCSFDKDDL